MFLYETPAISGSVAIHAVQLRHTPPTPLSLHPRSWNQPYPSLPSPLHSGADEQPQQPVPGGKDTTGHAIKYHNPSNYGPKEARKSCCGGDNLLLQGPAQFDFHNHHLSTRWHCVRPFLYMWGFSNSVQNACLSSVDWLSKPLYWDACLPCMVICCFLNDVKLM